MINSLLAYVAPHYCCGCGKIGSALCDNCKYNITFDVYDVCINCGKPAGRNGICKKCSLPYEKAWCVGERNDVLEKLINNYKFHYVKDSYKALADLLLASLDDLPKETMIVPIPTVNSHIRQRGYDHMKLIANDVAKQKKVQSSPLLKRLTHTKQRDASRSKRRQQAKEAFFVKEKLSPDIPYLIVDDVVTTGATMYYAAKALKNAGARKVWIAAIARQPPLD
jgi:ComF family protein